MKGIKFNKTTLSAIELPSSGDKPQEYYNIYDKRQRLIARPTKLSFVLKFSKGGERFQITAGHYPDTQPDEFELFVLDTISKIKQGFFTSTSNGICDCLCDLAIEYSKLHHKDSSGFIAKIEVFRKKFGKKRIRDIRKSHIIRFLAEIAQSVDSPTVGRYQSAFSKMFSIAILHDYLSVSPCAGLPKPKENSARDRRLSLEEIYAFIEAALSDDNPVHALALLLSLFTGLRQGNIRSLELSWFNADYTELLIPTSKSGKPIHHCLNKTSQEIVQLMLPYSDGKFLAPSIVYGKYMSKPTKCISRIRSYVQAKTGITEHFTAHDLRRTHASRMLQVCGDIRLVQQSLSHSDVKQTLSYAYHENSRLLDASEQTAQAMLGNRPLSSFTKTEEI
jgi:integrase